MKIDTLLADQLDHLRARIEHLNQPANVDGFFGRYVCQIADEQPVPWNVDLDVEAWRLRLQMDQWGFPSTAAIGYAIHNERNIELESLFLDAVKRVSQREAYPQDRLSFAFHPVAFLGITLGVISCGGVAVRYRQWLANVLKERPAPAATTFNEALYHIIEFLLTGSTHIITSSELKACDAAASFVAQRLGAVTFYDSDIAIAIQRRVLIDAMSMPATAADPKQALVTWAAARHLITTSVEQMLLSVSHVSLVLRRFETAMKRWRWDADSLNAPIQWAIKEEREVQDILWIILSALFPDVVDEEALPKLGHSFYKADFGIPSLRLLVEAKFCRSAEDFKRIEEEIMKDAFGYLQSGRQWYDKMVVFIYDDSSSVQEHETTRRALLTRGEIADVIIASRPSRLPPHSSFKLRKSTTRRKRS